MTPDEAREALRFHSGAHHDVYDQRWETGFLGSLRPYKGLRESNFHEVMAALRCLTGSLQGEQVDRETVSCLWGICHLGRAWGVNPGGMLRRNGLIAVEDVERLDRWIESISYAMMCLLDGNSEEGFGGYEPPAIPT